MISRQGQGGGVRPRLSNEETTALYEDLDNEQSHWTTQQVKELIAGKYQVGYSSRHVRRILRGLSLGYGKPYLLDYRQAWDAEEQLTERLRQAWQQLRERGIDAREVAIGFADESSPQTRANRVRLWSTRKQVLKEDTRKYRSSTFGFRAVKGQSVVSALSSSHAKQFMEMLRLIKGSNEEFQSIIVVWDNLPSHKTEEVEAEAKRLGIVLVNLPAYSPQLNPIEYEWKAIRREVAEAGEIRSEEELREIIEGSFKRLAKKEGFGKKWMRKYWEPLFEEGNPVPA